MMNLGQSPAQISATPIRLTVTTTVVTRFVPLLTPGQIAGEDAVLAALEEEVAARAFNAALVNTDSEDEWDGLGYAIASQEVLARDWLTPEDDIDWLAQIAGDEE